MTYGQAQKWLNIMLKYIWVMSENDGLDPKDAEITDKFSKFYHVPLDSYIIRYIKRSKRFKYPLGDNGLNEGCIIQLNNDQAWSRIADYSDYLQCQKGIRNNIKSQYTCPPEWELFNWPKALNYYNQKNK